MPKNLSTYELVKFVEDHLYPKLVRRPSYQSNLLQIYSQKSEHESVVHYVASLKKLSMQFYFKDFILLLTGQASEWIEK